MFDSQLYRKLSFTAAALGFLTAAACSNHPGPVASRGSVGGAGSGAAAVSPSGDSADVEQPNGASSLHLVTLPRGTEITAIVDQTLASGKNHWGDAFEASLAKPVKVDGKTVLPAGTEVTGRVLKVKPDELKVVLSSVTVDGVYCDLVTNARKPSDKDQPKRRKNSHRKQKKNNSVLSARTRLTFKLSKPATIPSKA